jgi:uncharacterized protein (TIGR00255 family)
MVRSMTGYGRVQRQIDGYNVLFEIKSVNNRYFDFSARLPRAYGFLEGRLKTYVQERVSRGKIEVYLSLEPADGEECEVQLNNRLALAYIRALQKLAAIGGLDGGIKTADIVRFSDIFTVVKPPENEERIWAVTEQAAKEAVASFTAMRETEGAKLSGDISSRISLIGSIVAKIDERSPQTVEAYRAKLTERMREVLADSKLDDSRILLEAALYADKVSVTEETVRLRSHIDQFENMLASGGPVGRKLDFLMQEMNREANTIGSKVMDAEMAGMVVDIKAELEKIREQIQNIE